MTTVASRTFTDHLRRRKEHTIAPDDPLVLRQAADAPEGAGRSERHPLDLLDLVVREIFRELDTQCLMLYRQWRVKREWKLVAADMNPPSTAAAVRKKYSRCMQRLLPRLREDPRYARIADHVGIQEDGT